MLAIPQGFLPLFALGDVTGDAVMAVRSAHGTVLVAPQIRDPAQGPVRVDNPKLIGTIRSAVECVRKLLPHACTVVWMDELLEAFGSRNKLVWGDAEDDIGFRRPPERVGHHIP